MAHELTKRASGKIEMAYVGEKPWHGLGQALEPGRSIEEWIVAAGMDWQAKRSRVRYLTASDDGTETQYRTLDDQHVLFRSDNKFPLGIVSDKYQIFQPRDVLEFFRDLTENSGFQLETAGTLFGGKRYWALARIGKDAVITSGDRVGAFLLLTTSYDGSTIAQFETIRVVCNNTLSMALSHKEQTAIKISHRSVVNPTALKEQLGVGKDAFAKWCAAAKQLAAIKLDVQKAEEMVFKLMDCKTEFNDETKSTEIKLTKGYKKVMELFGGAGKGMTPTAWGLVNAVTEYVDHHRASRTADAALDYQFWGDGTKLKTDALAAALQLA